MVEQPAPAMTIGLEKPCTHHWLIENPAGETSRGVCKYCGASRDFRNYAARGPYTSRKGVETAHA